MKIVHSSQLFKGARAGQDANTESAWDVLRIKSLYNEAIIGFFNRQGGAGRCQNATALGLQDGAQAVAEELAMLPTRSARALSRAVGGCSMRLWKTLHSRMSLALEIQRYSIKTRWRHPEDAAQRANRAAPDLRKAFVER